MERNGIRTLKVVVTGPFAVGKTTFIGTISETEVLSTERQVSEPGSVKQHTTVAMDFGRVNVDGGLGLHLFGTPGQERFDFMWKILAEGMLGFVLLVDAARPSSFDEAAPILDFFVGSSQVPYVVAVNRSDGRPVVDVEEVRERLKLPSTVPVVACDARRREDVKASLIALLEAVLERLEPDHALVPEGGA